MQTFVIVLLSALAVAGLHAGTNRVAELESASYAAVTNAADPVEQAFKKIMEDDDAAQAEVDQWIRENQAFAEQGAGTPPTVLKGRIQKRFEPVRKAYEDFLQLHPRHARARAAYASFLGDLGDEEAARVELEKALTFDTNSPAIYNNLANIYGHDGPVKKAFEFYTKAIQLDPREPVYYHNFATTVYLFRQDAKEYYGIDEAQVFAKAFELYSNALRLDPDNFPLASDIAQTYYGIKPLRTEEALGAWTNALRIAHDEIEREGVYLHFARLKYLAGHFTAARSHLDSITNSMYADLKQRLLRNLAEREFAGATPLQWSVRMADSEIERRGDSLAWKPDGKAKWDYAAGLLTLSLLKLNEKVENRRYVKFAETAIGSFIGPDGSIQGYKAQDYNLDNLNPGKTALALYQLTKEDRYRKAADRLRRQLDAQPRTSEGGFWHKQRYPHQMWLDGLYMASPFYAQYASLFGEPAAFDEVAKQVRLVGAHTYDPATGLFYHGWDESKKQDWANPVTGTSSNFWGRAIGWYGMAMVDLLDFVPTNHPARPDIIATLQKLSAGVVKHQDPASGLWYQVMDQGGRPGNYLEATAASMFVYVLAKGINHGYLPRDYLPAAIQAYRGIVEKLLKPGINGQVTLTQCCAVAGLGYGRSGSYDYYLKEPVVENDLKGVGPFILAGLEMQPLVGLPMTVPNTALPPASPTNHSTAPEWSQLAGILARIQPPVFPGREFPITDFGAVADGKSVCTEAIGKAIAACVKAGGGRVVVPADEFLTGPIHLRSRVELHLEGGATLKFTTDPRAYLPAVFTRFEGMECYNYSPLIYAFEQENVAVTGEGVLDGQASDETWWQWARKKPAQADGPSQKAARARLATFVEQGVPVAERRFGEGDCLRPSFVEFYRCRNVLVQGVRIRNSPMWELHPVLSTNVIVRGVDILSHGPNNDGCDPESCRDVLIEDCVFDTGDDCIAIKSGRNNDGRRVGVPSENIVIRRCTMKDGHGGVVIGSEISGGCRNVFAEECVMDSPHLQRVLRLKSNAVRGGVIENIFMRKVTVGQVTDAVLQIDFVYEEGANGPHKPVARNVVMENITVAHTPRVLNVVGFPGAEISGVRLYHSKFSDVQKPDVVKETGDVKLVDCSVERSQAKAGKP